MIEAYVISILVRITVKAPCDLLTLEVVVDI